MRRQIEAALAHPVFDPVRQRSGRFSSASLATLGLNESATAAGAVELARTRAACPGAQLKPNEMAESRGGQRQDHAWGGDRRAVVHG